MENLKDSLPMQFEQYKRVPNKQKQTGNENHSYNPKNQDVPSKYNRIMKDLTPSSPNRDST